MGNFLSSTGFTLAAYSGFGMPPCHGVKLDQQHTLQHSCPDHDQNDNHKHSKIQDLSSVICMK